MPSRASGGNIALEIAARYPDFPAGLVLLDSGVLFPASAGTVFAGYLEGLRGPDFADQARKIVADSCLPTDRCRAHVDQSFLSTPQHVLVSTFTSLFPWDVHRELANDRVPQAVVDGFLASAGHLGDRLIAAMRAGLTAGGEAGPIHSAGLKIVDRVSWPIADLRCDWTQDCPIEAIATLWGIYKPQLDAYLQRALNPHDAPRYGVPGDE